MRLAVLDLGSNSFHVMVVEARPDKSFEVVAKDKVVLRLGEAVAATGRLDHAAAARAVEAAVQLKAIADAAGTPEVVVVATSVFRSAVNGDDVAEQISAAIDAPVRILSGRDEASLTFDAIRASVLIDPGPALALDLGGGSLEVMVGDRAGMRWSRSLELGASRLTGELLTRDPPTPADVKALRRRVRQVLAPLAAEVAARRPALLVGSSGTIGALARAASASDKGEVPATVHQATVRAADLDAMEDVLVWGSDEDRAGVPGIDSRRAPIIAAGFLVVRTAMDVFGFDQLTVSEWAVREGVVLDAIGHLDPAELAADPRAIRALSVQSLCRRFGVPERHSRHVAELAVELFDRLRPVHGLGAEDRELLDHAAWLHDVGEHVARENHDRHSAYLVEHGRLRGFTPDEVAVLASLCRFHRRGTPKPSYEPFASLDEEARDRTVRLAALLRVADALDRSHASHVAIVDVLVRPDDVTLRLDATGDLTVELFGLDRKQELFERTFGRRLVVEPSGPSAAAGAS
jgi:exopolyphosphatase/guanosine-5'-triphosphate,3'-diphosphate pyrophosphatase